MLAIAFAVVRRPSLWGTAVRQVRRTAPPRWWRRAPFLPVPTRDYLGFRLVTQYGDPGASPTPHDVISYLEWCRDWSRG